MRVLFEFDKDYWAFIPSLNINLHGFFELELVWLCFGLYLSKKLPPPVSVVDKPYKFYRVNHFTGLMDLVSFEIYEIPDELIHYSISVYNDNENYEQSAVFMNELRRRKGI